MVIIKESNFWGVPIIQSAEWLGKLHECRQALTGQHYVENETMQICHLVFTMCKGFIRQEVSVVPVVHPCPIGLYSDKTINLDKFMGLQRANSDMNECVSCHNEYLNSYTQIENLFDGVKILQGLDDILLTDLLYRIASQLEEIYDGYTILGLISEDKKPYDEDSFQRTKIKRKIANGKTNTLESIPENLKVYFPSDQSESGDPSEFDDYREGLIDSASAREDINTAREILDGEIESIGDTPFGDLLCEGDDNVDKLAENLDSLFVEFIEKAKKFGYFF